MYDLPLPAIDGDKCTGCGDCIVICPEDVLVNQLGRAVLFYLQG